MKTFKNWSCSTVIWCKLGLGCSEMTVEDPHCLEPGNGCGDPAGLRSPLTHPNCERGRMKLGKHRGHAAHVAIQQSHGQRLVFNKDL